MASLLDPNPDDLAQLQGLLTQFEPSQAVKDAARKQAQMQFFLGLLGAPKGGEFQRIGQSGINAMNSYQNQIKQEQALRQQNVQAAAQVSNILRQQRLLKTAQDIFTGASDQPPAPGAAPAPAGGAPAMGGMPPTMPSGITTAPAPAPQAPQAAPMSVPTWRQLMPRAEQAMALASGDPKTIVESIRHYTDTKLGPNGLVTTVTGIPLYQSTDAGIQMFSPDGRPAEFMPYSQGANDAAAKRAATIEGAKTAAVEQAQFPYRTVTGPYGPNGAPVTGFQSQLLGNPQQPMQPPQRQIDLAPTLSPQERQAALADAQRSGYPQMGYAMPNVGMAGGAMVGADPLRMKQAEAAINTQAEQNSVIAKGQGQDYLTVIDSEKQAPGNIAKYELMKTYLGKIETGKLAPSVLGLKSVAAYIAPNVAKDFTKDVPYAQAVSALSNEIALQLRNPQGGAGMPGSMSDADRNFLVSMAANVSNDPRAIPMMIDARIAIEKRNQEIGKIARAYKQQHGTIDEGFYQQLQDYANSHPMFQGVDRGGAAPAGWSIRRIN